MEKWARWMNADTYEVVGQLNTFWVQILCELEEEHLSPTCSNITSVPACRDALRAETKIKYIVMSFFAFLPDTRASPKSLSKFKLATCGSAGTFW